MDLNLIFEDLWLIKENHFEFNVSLQIWLRYQGLAMVCGVVTGFENSGEKEGGSSL